MVYETTETGFVLHLDMTIYARPAVMKAFYHLQDKYLISCERDDVHLNVFFDWINEDRKDALDSIRAVLQEMAFEMLRYDTIRQTDGIRQLLVGRALYASCVDMEHEEPAEDSGDEYEPGPSWQEDRDRIFESWSEQ